MTGKSKSFADKLEARVRNEYAARDYRLGWRLLCSPAKTLASARVAFIGLNPGGSVQRPDHDNFAMDSGSAYELELWKDGNAPGMAPLQLQVRALFRRLGECPSDVLAGNLVPFRSPNWNSLPNKKIALQFGIALWHDIIREARPSLIITMGKEPRLAIAETLGVELQDEFLVNWGQIKAYRGTFVGGTFIGIPHLSRFKIMDRPESEGALTKLLEFRGHNT